MTQKNSLYASKKQKNRYIHHAHFSEKKFRQIIQLFVQDLPASKIAVLSGLSRISINSILLKIRLRIAAVCEAKKPFKGEVEVDESYFGPKRVKGKKGRGALGKTIVFGILEREKEVVTEVVPNCKAKTLQKVIKGRINLESVIHSDGWKGYDSLVDVGYSKHFRVYHKHNEFANKTCHINGIESFWSFAKRRLSKFNGISKKNFYLHLKECEFRFNKRSLNLKQFLLKLFRNNPL